MAKPTVRIAALQTVFGAALVLILVRAGWLQLVHGGELSRKAEALRTAPRELDARRGTIYDRNGVPLVVSQAKFRVQIALNEVTDTAMVLRRVAGDLGVSTAVLRRAFRTGTPRYPYFHGPFTAGQVAGLRELRGIHLETTYSRSYPGGQLAAPIIGRLDTDDGTGGSGLERSLDSVLAGLPGLTTDLRDPSGRRYESPGRLIREPVAGNDVVLTLDSELQAIAEYTLGKALRDFKAQGGNVVFADPRTGELLALASRTAAGAATPSYFTSPFEPGSTAKPFTAAALLALDRVSPTETVSGENGSWTFATTAGATRRIRDDHPDPDAFTLARAIRRSSNVAMAKFSLKLRPEEHYDMLRRFGFGAPSGVEFPSEAVGVLHRPHRWRFGYDAQSLAMGYSLSVTSVQLAAAYGSLANDGVLLAPTLVKEIRGPDGEMVYRHRPEVVRRVVPSAVAATVREYLEEAASDSGTGGRSQVRGGILGKTGTAMVSERGTYAAGDYRASFVAVYPVKDPQLVVVATIDRPRGAYYGGLTAAPLTAEMLRQALAARNAGLDRGPLAETAAPRPAGRSAPPEPGPRSGLQSAPVDTLRRTAGPLGRRSVLTAIVPDVTGRPLRAAVFALHQRGFRVRVEGGGGGRALRTSPRAGDSLPAGRTVVLYAGERVP